MSVFDNIIKRFNSVETNPFSSLIVNKIHLLKTKLMNCTFEVQEEYTSIWITIRILDEISQELYNE